jgi:hypothetical protein
MKLIYLPKINFIIITPVTSSLKGNASLTRITYCAWREELGGRSQCEGNDMTFIRETATSTNLNYAWQSHSQTTIHLTHARQ